MQIATTHGFDKQTFETYNKLLDLFKTIQQVNGNDATFSMHMLDGIVYIHSYSSHHVRLYTIEWFGKPEPFGLRIESNGSVYGPYHIH